MSSSAYDSLLTVSQGSTRLSRLLLPVGTLVQSLLSTWMAPFQATGEGIRNLVRGTTSVMYHVTWMQNAQSLSGQRRLKGAMELSAGALIP